MKSFVKTVVIMGAFFGIPMGLIGGLVIGVVRGSSFGVWFGVFGAVLSGLLFGVGMAVFSRIQRERFARSRPDFGEEQLLHDGPANHFLNMEGVGGWLFLTKERLLFRSHDVNIQRHEWSVPLTEIIDVRAVRTAKIFPNGLRVVSRSGSEDRFVVEAHRKWCAEITKARARLRN